MTKYCMVHAIVVPYVFSEMDFWKKVIKNFVLLLSIFQCLKSRNWREMGQ